MGNSAGIFGGFTETPQDYCIRRLLKLRGTQTTEPPEDDWELVKAQLESLICDLEFTNPDDEMNHWIPNTDEFSKSFSINIKGKDLQGYDVDLEGMDINLLHQRDPYFYLDETNKKEQSNIYKNRDPGIELYAAAGEAEDKGEYLLATCNILNEEEVTLDTHYTVVYNTDYFVSTDTGKPDESKGFQCEVHNDMLRVNYVTTETGKKSFETTTFCP
mgnify:CR=1 FL=1